jgi:hypothetical protein
MATEFCQKCKQSHPGRLCDYDEKGECAETVDTRDIGTGNGEDTSQLLRGKGSSGSEE